MKTDRFQSTAERINEVLKATALKVYPNLNGRAYVDDEVRWYSLGERTDGIGYCFTNRVSDGYRDLFVQFVPDLHGMKAMRYKPHNLKKAIIRNTEEYRKAEVELRHLQPEQNPLDHTDRGILVDRILTPFQLNPGLPQDLFRSMELGVCFSPTENPQSNTVYAELSCDDSSVISQREILVPNKMHPALRRTNYQYYQRRIQEAGTPLEAIDALLEAFTPRY